MSEELVNSLVITGIGMGLVFFAIILLWGMMEAMVRLFPEKAKKDIPGSTLVSQESQMENVGEMDSLKPFAAAVAVALAIALMKHGTIDQPAHSIQALSPWQSVMRANRLQQQNSPNTRTYKG